MRTSSNVLAVALLAAAILTPAAAASADPNVETALPANGVQSIDRDGDVWTIATAAPAWEIKVMSPRNEVLCGTNYGNPCATSVSFTAAAECVYLQVDGVPGWNSSDPYVCSSNPVTPTPTSTPTPEPTTPPATTPPVMVCPPGTVPGWLDEDGLPTSCVENNPTPLPTEPPVIAPPAPPVHTPATTPSAEPVALVTPATSAAGTPTPTNGELAPTGFDPTFLLISGTLLLLIGAIAILPTMRTRTPRRTAVPQTGEPKL